MIRVDIRGQTKSAQFKINESTDQIKTYLENKFGQANLLVELIITSPEEIRQLNKKYRDKDKTTDVLSFPIFNNENEIITSPDPITNLGTIVVNLNEITQQAIQKNKKPEEELTFLCLHSLDHLTGHHHPE